MFKPIAGLLTLLIALLVLFFLFRGDDEVSAEERYDGVHLCSPSQQAGATAEARTRFGGGATRGAGSEGPLFAQNSATWGREEYDHGARQDIGCGTTIEQCGCAMTSVATVLQLFQVMSTPDGTGLNPSTMNAWFNQGAKLTANGWVSQGYVYGSVVWSAINGWAPEISQSGEGGEGVSTELAPEPNAAARAQGIRFKSWGTGSEEEVRRELQAGRPVVLEVPGHYIAAVGLDGDQILINDPFYADRTTLASYAGRVKSSRLFEPSADMRSLMVTVPSNARVVLKDSRGRSVGTFGGDNPVAAQEDAATEIPGSMYQYQEAWRDPTCTERAPPAGAGTNTIYIPLPESGIYTVEVLGDGDISAGVHMTDRNGKQTVETYEGEDRIDFEVDYDSGTETFTTDPTPTPTASPTATTPPVVPTTPAPGITATAVPPTPTLTPTPSATPVPVTIVAFNVALDELALENPCSVTVTWNVTGPPDTVANLYRGRGTEAPTVSANLVDDSGPGQSMYVEDYVAGQRTYRLQAASPSDGSALRAPVTVWPVCIDYFATIDKCSQQVSFRVLGGPPGATWTLLRRTAGVGQFQNHTFGQVQYGEVFDFQDDASSTTDYEYALRVTVQGRNITTPSIIENWGDGCTIN